MLRVSSVKCSCQLPVGQKTISRFPNVPLISSPIPAPPICLCRLSLGYPAGSGVRTVSVSTNQRLGRPSASGRAGGGGGQRSEVRVSCSSCGVWVGAHGDTELVAGGRVTLDSGRWLSRQWIVDGGANEYSAILLRVTVQMAMAQGSVIQSAASQHFLQCRRALVPAAVRDGIQPAPEIFCW